MAAPKTTARNADAYPVERTHERARTHRARRANAPRDPVAKQRNNNVRRLGGVTGKGFLPGQSGNVKGRPKGSSITARLRKILENNDGEVAEAIARVIIREALKGRFRFAKEILDRVDGKVPNRIASFDGGPVLVQKVVGVDLDRL